MAAKSSATTNLPLDLPVLPRNWDYVPLAKLVDERRGISYGIVQPGSPVSDGTPIIRVNDIRGGRINDSDTMRISHDIESKYNRTRLQGGELLLTLVGTVGESAIVPKRLAGWNVARAVAVLPCNGDVSAPWVHLCLRSSTLKHFMRIWCTTTVQATLNLRDVARLPIPVPPKRERERITEILTSLDDKIELNRRMNETLEAIARRLFRSWFVDFDPVHAKAALRREHPKLCNADLSRRALPNMAPEIAELFPDSFEDSTLGAIPWGWRVGKVADVALKTGNGGTPKRGVAEYWEPEEVPWLTSGEVRQAIVTGTDQHISKRGLCNSAAKLWPAWTTVVALYGATAGQVTITAIPLSANQACCGLQPQNGFQAFLYLYVSSSTERLEQQARGSAQQNLSKQIVEDLAIIIPDHRIAGHFDLIVEPLFGEWIALLNESRRLAVTRDKLLPRLLSGELWT